MKVVFMGTPDFSVGTLEELIRSDYKVAAVVTQPDKPKGRGKAVQYPPVKEVALKYNIPVIQPVKVKSPEFMAQMKEINPDVIVVVAFGQIIPKELIELPKYGCVNVHGSLLPKYRGAAPIQWAVINGEKESGITTMRMDPGLDTGDMILKAAVPLTEQETGGSLFDKLKETGAQLLIKTLKQIESGTAVYEKQDDSLSNYAKRLTKEFGNIDWSEEAAVIERLIRGFNPWPSAYTHLNGKTLKIWSASVLESETAGVPGEVVFVSRRELHIKTGNGLIAFRELQLEGKKRMDTETFLRGTHIETGMILRQKNEKA